MKNYSFTYTEGSPELCDFPHINMFGCREFKSAVKGSLPKHLNPGIEICLILKGRFEWDVAGRNCLLYPGDATVTMPWQEHGGTYGAMDVGKLAWIIITPEKFKETGNLKLGGWSSVPTSEQREIGQLLRMVCKPYFRADDYLRHIFSELYGTLEKKKPRTWRVNHLLDELLFHVSQKITEPSPSRKFVFDIGLVEKRILADLKRKWALPDLEKITGYGKSMLNVMFRQQTGFSSKSYIVHLRVSSSKQRLEQTSESITRIACECGFTSSQQFSSVFKKYTGLSPSDFRRSRPGASGFPKG
ncbi:MAG: AraC family transcriptional regulator [Victivallales bacterium]|jgi:AraC-like DNA-binding protein